MELKRNNSTIKVHFITNTAPWWQYVATTCRWCAEDCVGRCLTPCSALHGFSQKYTYKIFGVISETHCSPSGRISSIILSACDQLQWLNSAGRHVYSWDYRSQEKKARFCKSLQTALSWKKFVLINTIYFTCMRYSHIWTGYTHTHPQHVCVCHIHPNIVLLHSVHTKCKHKPTHV